MLIPRLPNPLRASSHCAARNGRDARAVVEARSPMPKGINQETPGWAAHTL